MRLFFITSILFLTHNVYAFNGKVNSADTLWVIISSILVLLMIPALSIFYGGMVRGKNVLSTMSFSFVSMTVVGVLWFLIGHTIAFGPGGNSFVGSMKYLFLGKDLMTDVHGTIPESVFSFFQGMFAIITIALFSGAIVERFKFSSYVFIISLWLIFIYAPLAHFVWGENGFLANMGVLDFAGGLVVHLSSAVASLVLILMVGPRKGYPQKQFIPHNLVLTGIGTGLLWFGWFGFNAGSALAVNNVAYYAFINTFVAGAAGGAVWMFLEMKNSKPSFLGICSGIIAGLASITNAAGYVIPPIALLIGIMGGFICFYAIQLKFKLGYDDSLDVIGVHGVGGLIGALMTGLFVSINGKGLFYGNIKQFIVQIVGILVTILFVGIGTFLIGKLADVIFGLRVGVEEEVEGLDLSQHGESAYN
ncbi:ammonium transporter, Amt family [Deferribacter desulfuricans SSM1]|uniref:Ammonium transporter n=1 Tax=Deferribacter desulfuricans (strain DSM 14783 / JCM 11476 / NBRC 101012 / SSM1) TaxID=639282 RepID=D3PE53_DEFDS|nr:ammonium transporter [Deferribacter desulfuricans]BAI80876.1 ammonium transporter, Amt family [Deferribacter desulfuricans SSM1]